MPNLMIMKWSEKDRGKKIAFKAKYGRKPNKEEIKMLKKNLIDLSGVPYRQRLSTMNIQDQLAAKNCANDYKKTSCKDV
tara:strand:+ start:116 stop:352 length:237 start_codon:yes stop_codon:yes gene_type:complete